VDQIIHNIISCDEAGRPQTLPVHRSPSLISNIAGKSSGLYTNPGLTFGVNFRAFLAVEPVLPFYWANTAHQKFKMFYLYIFLPAGK
jgi:hypothetical protein